MRQGNPNKRLRGRNRKGPNPLTKTFESNGPDVKIRGTALHVAEKYLQLSRDAQVSGDRVMGENYLQHAEHYFRILAAAQGPNQPQQSSQRDDDQNDGDESSQQHGQHRGGQNGNGHSDPASSDQPSDSGFERHGANGNGNGGGNGQRPGRADVDADRATAGDGDDDEAETSGSVQQAGDAPAAGDDTAEAKPRRRARAPRSPRGRTRRASADGASDGPAPQPGNEAASTDA